MNFNYLKDMKQTSSEKIENEEEGEYRSIDTSNLGDVNVQNKTEDIGEQIFKGVDDYIEDRELDNIDLGE